MAYNISLTGQELEKKINNPVYNHFVEFKKEIDGNIYYVSGTVIAPTNIKFTKETYPITFLAPGYLQVNNSGYYPCVFWTNNLANSSYAYTFYVATSYDSGLFNLGEVEFVNDTVKSI